MARLSGKYQKMAIIATVVVEMVKEGVTIVGVYLTEQCYYNNNILYTKMIIRWI